MSRLLEVLEEGVEVFDLAQPLATETPHSPNHPPFRMSLMRRHGDMVREDGSSAANEMIVTGGHTGTHVDALAHVSYRGELHGGVSAEEAQRGGRFRRHGVDAMPPMVCRGVLLDVAALHGADALPGGYGITEEDLAAAARKAGVEVRAGDVALIRSGWGRYFGDAHAFLGHDTGVPGPTEEAARWLADRGVRATGAETIAYEQIKPGVGHALLPVHRLLLVERGVHIIEVMNLAGLAEAGVSEFLFVLAPLKIVGGTGSPVRPLAVVGR
ncbi:putative cyclase [Rubrobacter xylanophilus DSM 9941]|uniref:Putative cyclase n=1 Tax=Rubrobacter xylanophilus (strain DSM 9941 / JCM 11954 / NBRC 16129 / PRD-1) TaxID=266117 RepID=Q1AZ35_RUBXD|nr:cyclase family protein [Rubrobacter xylanophilus]ABG03343.1 putative cyclase [Rubrobacter xylanophilus DSM 9941]